MKTEKEKMLEYEEYLSNDKELLKDRQNVRKLLERYNKMSSKSKKEREKVIRNIINVPDTIDTVEPPFFCDYGYNITVGKDFYANFGTVILDGGEVKIGNNVMFGPNVQIYTVGHSTNIEKRKMGLEICKKIVIEDNVWIGGNVTICPGVTIGKGSVIGAGSVVTKDIPPNIVVAGNPCRYIKDIEN